MSRSERLLHRLAPVPVLWKVRLVLLVGLVVTNLVGAVAVYALTLVVPLPAVTHDVRLRLDNLVLAAVLVPVAVVVGMARAGVLVRRLAAWLRERREPDDAERLAVLRLPRQMFGIQVSLWTVSALLFGAYNALTSVLLGVLVLVIVWLAGLTTSVVTLLLTERVVRPLARRALATGVPSGAVRRSVALRAMSAWLLGTGLAVIGIVLSGLTALVLGREVSRTQLAVTMVVLGGTAFLVGSLVTWMAAKATSDPVRALRRAVSQVREGRLDADVEIYDGTEIGVLQAGFNQMLAGLRERDRIRDLFGRHVGDDVARTALERGVRLGGEARDVAVLFVDVVGSTTLATERPPEEVVRLLNRFFDVVIEVVHEHGGWINKFEGDAALAVWGAPVPVEGMAGAALGAARTLGERLEAEVPEIAAAIGVSAGRAVAGNVGAASRYEYTVIGDPVNEAARLTELAKQVPARVLAHANLLDGAGGEATRWERLEPVTVRGRSTPTPVTTPASPGQPDGARAAEGLDD